MGKFSLLIFFFIDLMSVPSQVDKLKERMKILDSMDEKLKNIEEFIKQLKAYEGEKKT